MARAFVAADMASSVSWHDGHGAFFQTRYFGRCSSARRRLFLTGHRRLALREWYSSIEFQACWGVRKLAQMFKFDAGVHAMRWIPFIVVATVPSSADSPGSATCSSK